MANDNRTSRKAGNGQAPARPNPAERVAHVLRGEVIDIYLRHVPAFKGLDRDKVYDLVIGSPALAAECYALFTKRPDLFEHLMIDKNGAPVKDEKQRLSCGRSLAEVTAMVVRAVARRHFLQRFKPPPPPPPPAPPGFGRRLYYLFKKPPPLSRPRRKATRGDSLYRALRHHLLYQWQLPLIPHYTPLPVSLVRQLGAKILEYRTVAALKQLLQEGLPPESAEAAPGQATAAEGQPGAQTVKPVVPQLIRIKLPGGERAETVGQAKVEAMWAVARALKLNEVFSVDEAELRRMIVNASVTSGNVINSLSSQGLKMRNLVVLLCAFERKFGKARMPAMFGPQAKPAFIAALGTQIKAHGIGELQQPYDIKNRVETVIYTMQRNRQLPM